MPFHTAAKEAHEQMKTASWVIINKATGNPLTETFNENYVNALNTEKYQAVPIMEYLTKLNAKIKAAQ